MASSEKSKLFVGGVSSQTNEHTLREHFTHFGTVEDVLIIRHGITGVGRGFAFVKFADSSMAQEALKHDNHVILGKKVDVKPTIAKDYWQEQSNGNSSNGDGNIEFSTKKVFVGGLSPDLTEEEFKSYFESFGTITDAVIIYEKESRRPRGFGFITFDSEDVVDNVLKNRYHELKHKMVEVKRAQPKDRNDRCMNYYETGLGFGGFPYCYTCIYPTCASYYCYRGWNPYALNGVCGSSVASNSNGFSPSPLSLGNPAVHPTYVFYPSYVPYENGCAIRDLDSINCNGNYHQMAKPTANSKSNSNGDYDNDTTKVPETMKSPRTDDLPLVKNNTVEPQDGEVDDLSSSKSIVAEHQGEDIHDSTFKMQCGCPAKEHHTHRYMMKQWRKG